MAFSRRSSIKNVKLIFPCVPHEDLGEGMDVQLHSFLTSQIERNERKVTRPGHFTPTEKAWTYT